MLKNLLTLFFHFVLISSLKAQEVSEIEMADVLRENGKIYIVVIVILIILIGLFAYLFHLDKKTAELAKKVNDNNVD